MTEIQEGSKVARVVEAAQVLVQGPMRLVVETYADRDDLATTRMWEQYDELSDAVKAAGQYPKLDHARDAADGWYATARRLESALREIASIKPDLNVGDLTAANYRRLLKAVGIAQAALSSEDATRPTPSSDSGPGCKK